MPEPNRHLVHFISLNLSQITSLAFGGANFDELYVTTGTMETPENKPQPPINGSTYRITGLGTKGLPAPNFKL